MSIRRKVNGRSPLADATHSGTALLGVLGVLSALTACQVEVGQAGDSSIQAPDQAATGGTSTGGSGDAAPVVTASPYDTPVVCTSDAFWTGGNSESPRMNPGEACISCHTEKREGPELSIAGTLYPTAHEPDTCNGVTGSATVYVEITDANNRVFKLQPNSAGNFMLEDPDAFSVPYTAKVVSGDQERIMLSEQVDGDCNTCHTEEGTSNAPGRIMLP